MEENREGESEGLETRELDVGSFGIVGKGYVALVGAEETCMSGLAQTFPGEPHTGRERHVRIEVTVPIEHFP